MTKSEVIKFHSLFKVLIILLVVLAVPITVFIAKQRNDTRQRASQMPITAPSQPILLAFSPSSLTKNLNETFDISLGMNSGSYSVIGVDLTVSYNANVLELTRFQPSGLMADILINEKSVGVGASSPVGSLRFAATDTRPAQNNRGIRGGGGASNLGTLTFRAKSLGYGYVDFQKNQVTALGYNEAIDTQAYRSTYIVAMPAPSATSTPGITVSPTSGPLLGDINGDGSIDVLDYNIWREEFLREVNTKTADLNNDGKVDLLDFAVWRNAFGRRPTPTLTPVSQSDKRVFVTSTTYNGNLGGLIGADAKCQERANAGNLPGTYKAWLSDSTTSTSSRLVHNSGAYIATNAVQRIVADNWVDLTDGSLKSTIKYTEYGTEFPEQYHLVWTGSSISGGISGSNCNNWTSSTTFGSAGDISEGASGWTHATTGSCSNNNLSLYCLEQ